MDFIPTITEGHQCTPVERQLLSLPVRLGGLGIPIFSEMCDREFNNSKRMTETLTKNIKNQVFEYTVDREEEKKIQQAIKKERQDHHENLLKEIRKSLTKEELRANDLTQMKGSSAWLNALPLESEDYYLTKRVFFDAINDRYRWQLKRLPLKCVCGANFTSEHAMQCANGGFIHKRHNKIRDAVAKMLNEVACDVRVEPP